MSITFNRSRTDLSHGLHTSIPGSGLDTKGKAIGSIVEEYGYNTNGFGYGYADMRYDLGGRRQRTGERGTT